MTMPEQAMSGKEKRVMEAHRLRYMENKDDQEIADILGLELGTVRNYFAESDSDKYKRFYTDKELYQLQQSLEQDVADGNNEAKSLLGRAMDHPEAKPSTLVRAAKEAQKIRKRKIEMLQELGIIDKKPEKTEVHKGSGGESLEDKLREAYQELQEEEEGQEVEQDA